MSKTKQHSIHRRNHKPPCRTALSSSPTVGTPNRPALSSETSGPSTASKKKLFLSPHHESESSSYSSSSDSESKSEGRSTGALILELSGMRGALEASVCCLKCREKITLTEEIHRSASFPTFSKTYLWQIRKSSTTGKVH